MIRQAAMALTPNGMLLPETCQATVADCEAYCKQIFEMPHLAEMKKQGYKVVKVEIKIIE